MSKEWHNKVIKKKKDTKLILLKILTIFLPNLLRNIGLAEKDQVGHTDYKFNPKKYK